jgi:hypothetical protein
MTVWAEALAANAIDTTVATTKSHGRAVDIRKKLFVTSDRIEHQPASALETVDLRFPSLGPRTQRRPKT